MEIDIQQTLIGDLSLSFFLETTFRTVLMFLVMVVLVRLTGKRGLRQLSPFEIAVVIIVGPSAGDAMFYSDFGLAHVAAGFIIILLVYRLVLYFIRRNEETELLLVGGPELLIREGIITRTTLESPHLGRDELFGELRHKGVEHLGQVRSAILEDDGELSLFFYESDQVKPGLPILPDEYREKSDYISQRGIYACSVCGTTEELGSGTSESCGLCHNGQWVKSLNRARIV